MYEINYNDERFKEVESDRQVALTENEQLYGNMIAESEQYYQAQIDASKQWAETQQKIQQEKTDFAIDQIEQQKDETTKDYKKEQTGAYVDWQEESNKYGTNAELIAAQGLANSGYSESSQVSMYNTYQNRVATAREGYNTAILNYNNSIKEAKLQNNSILAEIAYQAMQEQLELSLQGFQYKNQLLAEMESRKAHIDSRYDSLYQDVLDQINHENALAEEMRQFDIKQNADNSEIQEDNTAIIDGASGEEGNGFLKALGGSLLEAMQNRNATTSGNPSSSKPTATSLTIGGIMTEQKASEFGLDSNDEILKSGGNYYVEKDGTYVQLTNMNPLIDVKLNSWTTQTPKWLKK